MARRSAVNVLLDTCALVALSRGELPARAAAALRIAPEACVSVVGAWEVAIKTAAGKLRLGQPPASWFEALKTRHRLREVPLDFRLACAAAALPLIHRDPFDRVLVALAQSQSLTLLTSDRMLAAYPNLHILW
jgi:PIN domain nuclease of toxin-antitoxin system